MELASAPAAVAVVVVGLGIELRLFAPSRAPRRWEAIVWSIGWLLLAVAVAAGIALTGGPTAEGITVYLIERALSFLDMVFLFSLLLVYFLVPLELRGPYRHRHSWCVGSARRGDRRRPGRVRDRGSRRYVFGVLPLCVAYRAIRGAAEESDPAANPRVPPRPAHASDLARLPFPLAADPREVRLHGTLLGEWSSDHRCGHWVAVDSIPAAFAATCYPVVIWSATRSRCSVSLPCALVEIRGRRFGFLDETIALILAFVGIKISSPTSSTSPISPRWPIIGAFLGGGIVAALAADRSTRLTHGGADETPAPVSQEARIICGSATERHRVQALPTSARTPA